MRWVTTEKFEKSEFNEYLVKKLHKISYPTDQDGNSEQYVQRKRKVLYTI